MTPQETKYYLQAMDMIKAEERLENMDANDYPHMQPKERSKRHRVLMEKAYPENFKKKVLKTSDIRLI